jgi:ubiquinol-cytochrome c reductase cytochrome c subunit
MVGLVLTGALYSVFAPAQAADDTTESAAEAAGRELYNRSCITCHGSNLEGVPERGPSLIGVGEASVYFQVHTGRIGPVSEGLVIWVVGIGALLFGIFWMGSKA